MEQPDRFVPIENLVECNHRVSNHFALLASAIREEVERLETGPSVISRRQATTALEAIASRVATASALHRALMADPEEAEITAERALGGTLQALQSLFDDRLRVRRRIAADSAFPARVASVLAFSLAEIVTNALKYAHPNGVAVEISLTVAARDDGGLTVEVADDGVGLPKGFDLERDGGSGMKMMHYTIDSIRGELTMRSNARGLTYSIALPAPGAPPAPSPRGIGKTKKQASPTVP